MKRPLNPAWEDASIGACLCAIAPALFGGVLLRSSAGPVRDHWLALLTRLLPADVSQRRIPLNISDSRLLGGLDLCATLERGTRVTEPGVLQEINGGVAILAMADRLRPELVVRLLSTLDRGEVVLERDGISARFLTQVGFVALDESDRDEPSVPHALTERLALHHDLTSVAFADLSECPWSVRDIVKARALLPEVTIDDRLVKGLCSAALQLGILSMRSSILACQVSRVIAALMGNLAVTEGDAACAARLVLAPRAVCLPGAPEQQPPPAEPPITADAADAQDAESKGEEQPEAPDNQQQLPETQGESENQSARDPDDVILAAAQAAIPHGLLTRLKDPRRLGKSKSTGSGGSGGGEGRDHASHGRPNGSRAGQIGGQARLHVLETLRAAAPWQAMRRRERAATVSEPDLHLAKIEFRPQDFQVRRFVRRPQTTTIFVVDASGSAALHRLAETKGAIELLLAECYVRRDRVAVFGFRRASADLLLPPTRSLVRAKRSLAALPASGGTPLATAIDASSALAEGIRRHGDKPVIVLLSDGQANVARDGSKGRERAHADAMSAASSLRCSQVTTLFVDTSPRPADAAHRLADQMGAQYLALPHVQSSTLYSAIRMVQR